MSLYYIPKYQITNEKFPFVSREDIVFMDNLSNLSARLKHLTTLLEIPSEGLAERRAACAEILQILRKFYPDSSLIIYGSSINSFGMKGCDLDLLFLPFPSFCNLDYATNEKEKLPVPNPASILTGEVSNDVLTKLDEYTHLKFIRAVLRREKVGKRANFIPAPKCPILRVIFSSNKLVCDISASNRLVVFNSELLQFFEKLDERVKPLVICLRFWASSLGFIKRSFFSSYGFTLLVIFFLQTLSCPILPSVQRLTEISGISRMAAGWETAFSTDVESVSKSKNNLNISELFTQFFDFYYHFDFLQYAVSPHDGKPLPIEDIKNSTDERMADFEITPVNIQDLFILSRNVCRIEKIAVFKLALLTAHKMLTGDEKVEFHTLFNPDAYQCALDSHFYKYVGGRSQVCFIHLDFECMKKFGCLEMWYEQASQAVYEVLQYGMLMECEVTDKVCSGKKKDRTAYTINVSNNKGGRFTNSSQMLKNKLNDAATTPYDLQLLMSMECILYSRTWIGRKNVEVTTSTSDSEDELEVFEDSVLNNEYCISKSLVKKNPLLSSPVPVLCFRCDCYKHVSPEFKDLVVILKPVTLSREFYQVSAFLSSFIPKTVKKILKSN